MTLKAMTNTFEEIRPFFICLSYFFYILPPYPDQHESVDLTTLKFSIHAQTRHLLSLVLTEERMGFCGLLHGEF